MAVRRIRLAQRRRASGFTQEKLAAHLNVDRTTVVRWEAAETDPQPWVRPKLAAALDMTAAELEAVLAELVLVEDEPSERITQILANPTSADLVAASHLQELLRKLDESYYSAPSTVLLEPAGRIHAQVRTLREHATRPRVRRALCEVEAEAGILMSLLVWDVSQRRDHLAPIRYLDDAVEAARLARNPVTEAYATLRKSYVSLYGAKKPREGLAFAAEAAAVAESASPALAGLALAHVAEGYAMAIERADCEKALDQARAHLGRIDITDEAAPYFTVEEFNRLAGSCYLFLELPERAEPILRSSVDALADKKKCQSIALANLALALIRQRKLEEAASALHRAIDTVELTRGGGGLNLVFAAGRELRPWQQENWAQELYDRLLALIAAI